MAKISTEDIERQAAAIVDLERQNWTDAVAFVTERVAFNMRNLIRQCQKNYWGVFDKPVDPVTGRDKIWVPYTESLVEAVVKNIDLDTKDINFRSRKSDPATIGLTAIIRSIVRNYLDKMNFGELLDDMERRIAIEGTAVWKTLKLKEKGKDCMKVIPIPLLNVYIDPTAPSIQEAYRFTERTLMTVEEIRGMKGWVNTKGIQPSTGLDRNDSETASTGRSGTNKYVDVWEMWGKIPKSLITGNEEDTEDVDGRIVVSGLESGRVATHLIETTDGTKPYEEFWYTKVPGRWYGRGVAEKVMMLQIWYNLVVNLRINRQYINQLGIWKIKKGAGITPQMISRLASNGAITVNNIDDIEQLVMNDIPVSSYKDEDVIQTMGQRVTAAFETVTGETLPASTSATQIAIQNQNGQSQFALVKEGIGHSLERWVERQAIPIIMSMVKKGDVVRIVADPEEVRMLDERIVNERVYELVEQANAQGIYLDPMQVEMERQKGLQQLLVSGESRWSDLLNDIDPTAYDVDVYVTNEEFDHPVMVDKLLKGMQLAPEFRDQILQQIFDLMGIGPLKKPMMPPMAAMPSPDGKSPDLQGVVTSSNTLQNTTGF